MADEQRTYIPMWAVHWNTSDYPNQYVARLFHNETPQHAVLTGTDLSALRAELAEMDLVPIQPMPGDVHTLVEVWL